MLAPFQSTGTLCRRQLKTAIIIRSTIRRDIGVNSKNNLKEIYELKKNIKILDALFTTYVLIFLDILVPLSYDKLNVLTTILYYHICSKVEQKYFLLKINYRIS